MNKRGDRMTMNHSQLDEGTTFHDYLITNMTKEGYPLTLIKASLKNGYAPEVKALTLIRDTFATDSDFQRVAQCVLNEGEYTLTQMKHRDDFMEIVTPYLNGNLNSNDPMISIELAHVNDTMLKHLSQLCAVLPCGALKLQETMLITKAPADVQTAIEDEMRAENEFALMHTLEDAHFALSALKMPSSKARKRLKEARVSPLPQEALDNRSDQELESLAHLFETVSSRDSNGDWRYSHLFTPRLPHITWEHLYNLASLTDEYNLEWALAAMEW